MMNSTNTCSMPLSRLATIIGSDFSGEDTVFTGVSTDTRTVKQGELFFAINGENFDAHDYLQQAADSGAVAAVVSKTGSDSLPLLAVEDTVHALGQLAQACRMQFSFPVVGITGSNGKTTVKEMIASILQVSGEPLVTIGNLNNDIGVPLTLLRSDESYTHAVIEMGANHIGEIAYLTKLARPQVGVVTNALSAHLEGFGSRDGVALAKGELFDALQENNVAIINADDSYCGQWQLRAQPASIVTFGLNNSANVTARDVSFDPASWQTTFTIISDQGMQDIAMPLVGRHNVMNALAAAAAALALGISLQEVAEGLQQMSAVGGRLHAAKTARGSLVIDDSYNANPDSLQAGLDVLAMLPGKRILVLGDMAELGEAASSLHADIAASARQANVQYLYAVGELSAATVQQFGNGGQHFENKESLLRALNDIMDENSVALVKGSRRMQMDSIVKALLGETK